MICAIRFVAGKLFLVDDGEEAIECVFAEFCNFTGPCQSSTNPSLRCEVPRNRVPVVDAVPLQSGAADVTTLEACIVLVSRIDVVSFAETAKWGNAIGAVAVIVVSANDELFSMLAQGQDTGYTSIMPMLMIKSSDAVRLREHGCARIVEGGIDSSWFIGHRHIQCGIGRDDELDRAFPGFGDHVLKGSTARPLEVKEMAVYGDTHLTCGAYLSLSGVVTNEEQEEEGCITGAMIRRLAARAGIPSLVPNAYQSVRAAITSQLESVLGIIVKVAEVYRQPDPESGASIFHSVPSMHDQMRRPGKL